MLQCVICAFLTPAINDTRPTAYESKLDVQMCDSYHYEAGRVIVDMSYNFSIAGHDERHTSFDVGLGGCTQSEMQGCFTMSVIMVPKENRTKTGNEGIV